VRVCLGYYLER